MVTPHHSGPLSTTTHLTKAPKSSWRHCRPYQDEEDDTLDTAQINQLQETYQEGDAAEEEAGAAEEEHPECH